MMISEKEEEEEEAPESPPSPIFRTPIDQPSGSTSSGMPTGAIVGLVLGLIIIVLLGVYIFVCRYRKKKRDKAERLGGGGRLPINYPSTGLQQQNVGVTSSSEHKVTVLPGPVSFPRISPLSREPSLTSSIFDSEKPFSSSARSSLGFSHSSFSHEELSKATDDFSEVNLLGQGGFGFVYKGILSDGKVVAVKQRKAGSRQGEREFLAEIETISRVHHRHLVSLVGYCINGDQMLLVYEFVPNNTLEFHLYGKGRTTMNWATRMKIATGSAKGLAYLHEDCFPKIIHRDIKAANILLDHSFEAKVADFGLAKYFSDTETHVSTRVMGTFGYMAPEYASSGKLTEKSDVFSFGVVLLELITGRRPVARTQSFLDDTDSIVDWARPLLQRALQIGNYDTVVDPKLQKDYDTNEMIRVITCAVACVNHAARHRPQMSQIVRVLEGNMSLGDLNKGPATGYIKSCVSYENSDYSSRQYRDDLVKFRKLALESQEQSSTDYSAYSSDYVTNTSSSCTEGQQTTQETKWLRSENQGLSSVANP